MLGTEVGRYRLESKLGQGGMGAVYLGVNDAIGSRVAVKILSDSCSDDPEMVERFFAEARAVNMIRHENIVDVLDLGRLPDGRPFMVMELVDGQTLGHIVRRSRAPLGGIASVAIEVLSALEGAHAIGIVHRDLKPDNVLITPKGHAKVLDFGIAKLARSSPEHVRTMTGVLLGTPAYMSPEQSMNAGTVDGRSDIYAAGILLFEAITSRLPFTGSTYELMRAHADDPPPPARMLRPDLPPAFEQVIGIALEKDPARRYQSAGHMAAAIREASRGLPPHEWQMIAPVARSNTPVVTPGGSPGTSAGPPFVGTPPAMSVVTPSAVGTPVAPSAFATPGTSSVVAPSVVAPSVVAPSRRSRLPFVLGGIALVTTVIIIGIVVARSGNDSSGGQTKRQGDPDKSNASYLEPPKNPKRMPAGWDDNPDPKNLTLGAAIKLGFALSQMKARDARFVELQLHPIAKTGKVDLSRAKQGAPATKVVFESESLRAAGEKCQLTITLGVATDGVMTQGIELDTAPCKQVAVPLPRCGLKHLVETTKIAGKSQADETPLTARYTNVDGQPLWTLEWQVLTDEPTLMDSTYLDALCRD